MSMWISYFNDYMTHFSFSNRACRFHDLIHISSRTCLGAWMRFVSACNPGWIVKNINYNLYSNRIPSPSLPSTVSATIPPDSLHLHIINLTLRRHLVIFSIYWMALRNSKKLHSISHLVWRPKVNLSPLCYKEVWTHSLLPQGFY